MIVHATVAEFTIGLVPAFAFSLRNADGVAGIVVVFAMTQS